MTLTDQTTIISTVFSPAKGTCAICGFPASWKYIKGPLYVNGDLTDQSWRDEPGELWCERCRKLYDLEGLRGRVEELEKELDALPGHHVWANEARPRKL
jgi:hypothetical protein